MNHVKVKSSNIESIAHDGAETMHVTFKGGATYEYKGVTVEGHTKLMNAASPNGHLRSMNVKGTKI